MFGWITDWIMDFVYKIFYGISKSLYQIIDSLMACANKLCGIDPITYQGAETDFISFLLRNQAITYGFVAASLLGVVLVFVFAVFAVLRSTATERDTMTPTQTFVKVGKILLTFLFIPVCMAVIIWLTNVFMQTLYKATLGGSPDGLGRFMAGAFGQDARKEGVAENFYLSSAFNYRSTSNVKEYLDLSEYDYIFSYLASIVVLICLAKALLMFVDRAISLIVLYIFCPISLSTAIIDDGQRFKLWRDQFLVKFLTGYGCIIAINIYVLIVAAITSSDLVFFDNWIMNNFMKIAIIAGGAVSMQAIMALVGNLIGQGAGSNELRDNAIATSQMRGVLGRAAGVALSPFKATRSAANFIRDSKQYGTMTTIGQRLGFRTEKDYGKQSAFQKAQQRQQFAENENYRRTGKFENPSDKIKNSISGENGGKKDSSSNNKYNGGGGGGGKGKGNANNNMGNKMVEMQILNNKDNKDNKK